jgi:hypothetical protein
VLLSELIERALGGAACAVLMGANVASEVAEGQLCEATIGVRDGSGLDWLQLFHQPRFRCRVIPGEIPAIEMLGALKGQPFSRCCLSPSLSCYHSNSLSLSSSSCAVSNCPARFSPSDRGGRTLWHWRRALPTGWAAAATPRPR